MKCYKQSTPHHNNSKQAVGIYEKKKAATTELQRNKRMLQIYKNNLKQLGQEKGYYMDEFVKSQE